MCDPNDLGDSYAIAVGGDYSPIGIYSNNPASSSSRSREYGSIINKVLGHHHHGDYC